MTSREQVDTILARIAEPQGVGGQTFIRVFAEPARAAADAWDRMRASGAPLPPLAGIPIAVKDLFDVAGSVTTAASPVLRDAPPAAADAAAVARLRAAGAVIIGTTNMTEFAFGSLGINPHYGTPPNPFDRAARRIPGGSSSGAAISVSDEMARIAIGSDTAGSIRAPAAYCGIVGFKPTAARVPLAGSIPLAASLDSIGPLARTVADCALADAVLAGCDPAPLEPIPLAGLRLGVPRTVVLDDLEPAVAQAFEHTVTLLSSAGARMTEIDVPEFNEILERNVTHSFTVTEGYAWHRNLLETRGDRYDPIVAARFRDGAKVTAADYIALRETRARLIQSSRRATAMHDALLMPTLPITARTIAELEADKARYLATAMATIRNPNLANALDRCALTIPCHASGTAPVGVTLLGETMADRRILAIGLSVEEALA